jgi:outer membrane protein OmpA-like peptidoglycan-associated protein
VLRRKCHCGAPTPAGETCSACAANQAGLQRKLAIGRTDDPLEAEADRMADAVMARHSPGLSSQVAPGVRRQAAAGEESAGEVSDSVVQTLASVGAPLGPAVRSEMEGRFGRDFSRVRLHSDASAAQSARDVHAAAYTAGNQIVFGQGQLDPNRSAGRHLLAHELAHVVQQETSGRAAIQREPLVLGDHEDDPRAALLWESYRQSITLAAFKPGSAELTPEHLAALKEYKERLGLLLGRYPGSSISVIGYTDTTSTEARNAELGQARADAVLKELTSGDFALAPGAAQAASLGETALAVQTQAGEPRNRRVMIIPTLRRGLGSMRGPQPGQPFDGTLKVDPNPRRGPPYQSDPVLDTTPIPEFDSVPGPLRPDRTTGSDRPVLPPPKPSDTPGEHGGMLPKKKTF